MPQTLLPKITIPPGKELWELAKRENWPDLETLLNAFEGFYVRDATAENHLYTEVRKSFDECQSPGSPRRSFIASLLVLCRMHQQAYAAELLQRLLFLGLHPDLPTTGGGARWRPSHYCSWNNRKEAVEVLGVCRPDLGAKDIGGDRPRAIGEHGEHLWREIEVEGFPTISRLAHDKKWWAVANLTRRRVVSEDEKFSPYKGKDAIQWAKHYGEVKQAEELNYLLHSDPAAPVTGPVCELGPQLQAVSDQIACLQEKVDCDRRKSIKFNALVEEHQGKLLEVVLKGEADELKEGIALCLIRMTEETENMKNKMEALCEAVIAKECEKHTEEVAALKADLVKMLNEEREGLRNEARQLQKSLQERLEATIDASLIHLRDEMTRHVSDMTFMLGSPPPTPPVLIRAQSIPPDIAIGLSSRTTETSVDPNTFEIQDPRAPFLFAAARSLNPFQGAGFAQAFLDLVDKYK